MFQDIQKYIFRKEIVSVYDSWDIDCNVSVYNQLDKLHEDILQITFLRGYLLDVGWYPEHSINGSFKGVLIRYENWEKPIYEIKTEDTHSLVDWITEVIELVFDFKTN